MALRPLTTKHLQDDFIPQAVVAMSEGDLRRRVDLVRTHDDFDWFLGGAFALDEGTRFALRHYDGHPPDTFTIYLDRSICDIEAIMRAIGTITWSLDIAPDLVVWDRSKDPDL